jgi:cytochrome b6
LTLGFGFSGYLLPWNELSYYATLVGTQIPGAIPVVGDWVVHLLRGGTYVADDTLTRFFAAHVMFLPLACGGLLAVHVGLIQAQGMSLPLGLKKEKVRGERPFISEFLLIDACIWLVAFGAIVTLAALVPVEIGVKADPLRAAPAGIKPEWYFLFMFQTLKVLEPDTLYYVFHLFGVEVPKALIIDGELLKLLGVLFFAVVAAFLTLVPFLDRNANREKRSPRFTAVFVILVVYAAVFEIWAMMGPGIDHGAGEPAASDNMGMAGSLLTLGLIWAVIGFLVFYLRQLLKENARIREMYR